MNFDAATINRVYNLKDDDNEEYRALFQNTNYKMMLRSFMKRRCEWKRHPSTFEVTTFPMVALKFVPKPWYNFLYATLFSIVTKDKEILLYAIVKDIKFNVGYVIERGIIELTQG